MQDLPHQHRFEYPNDNTRDLFRTILALESVEECEKFFRDLCTMQELKAMTERWRIAKMVWQGVPYRVITQVTRASSTTIARVAHWLTYGQGGYEKACQQLPTQTPPPSPPDGAPLWSPCIAHNGQPSIGLKPWRNRFATP